MRVKGARVRLSGGEKAVAIAVERLLFFAKFDQHTVSGRREYERCKGSARENHWSCVRYERNCDARDALGTSRYVIDERKAGSGDEKQGYGERLRVLNTC